MTTSTVTPEIVAFAQGVRAALADLPAEEVDDLTEGLEADLAEAYAEDLQRELPDPAAYATELRAAAGLPMRTKAAKSRSALGPRAGLEGHPRRHRGRDPPQPGSRERASTSSASCGPPGGSPCVAGGVARARAFFGNERGYGLPSDVWWLVLVAFVRGQRAVGSGQWHGRGVWPALIAVGNVVAAVVAAPGDGAADDWSWTATTYGYEDGVDGATRDDPTEGLPQRPAGRPTSSRYDAKGKPLEERPAVRPGRQAAGDVGA